MLQGGKKRIAQLGIGTVIFAVTFVISYFAVQFLFFDNGNPAAKMKEAAADINANSPQLVDQFTRLDSVTAVADKSFRYHYTLFQYSKEEINLDTVNKYVRPGIIERVKTHPEMEFFRENEIIVSYLYYDKNGELVTSINVTPDMYK
ncbi:MAG TPA: hypothetical protein VFM60_07210 [Salinimicrobium sp.]|nr:hypothetical protein [Salinimicrobium sp.]